MENRRDFIVKCRNIESEKALNDNQFLDKLGVGVGEYRDVKREKEGKGKRRDLL